MPVNRYWVPDPESLIEQLQALVADRRLPRRLTREEVARAVKGKRRARKRRQRAATARRRAAQAAERKGKVSVQDLILAAMQPGEWYAAPDVAGLLV